MRISGTMVALALAVVLVAGCGGGEKAESKSEPAPVEPTTADVTVTLQDFGQLDGLFNHDDQICVTVNAAEMVSVFMDNPGVKGKDVEALYPKTTVTLADAEGTTVGMQELPIAGGDFVEGTGCTWPIEFPGVDASEFYEVTFVHGDFSASTQFEGGSTVEADLTF